MEDSVNVYDDVAYMDAKSAVVDIRVDADSWTPEQTAPPIPAVTTPKLPPFEVIL